MRVEESPPIGHYAQDHGAESQRRDERDSLMLLARIQLDGAAGEGEMVRVRNVSSGGLMAQASEAFRPGLRVAVELDGIGRVRGSVAWAEAGRIGIAFDHPIDKVRARKPKPLRPGEDERLVRPVSGQHKRPPIKSR